MTRDEKLALTGDYVLGLLNEVEAQSFEQTCKADAELAGMTARLSSRMTALDETAAPARYSPDLWRRIESQLGAVPQPEPEPEPRKIIPMAPRRPKLQALQWLPLAASVIVALGVGFLAGTSTRTETAPTVIAVLLNQNDASPAVIIEAFADDSVRLVPLENFAAPEGQVLQVWTLPDPATGPVSLGTLPTTRDVRLDGPNLALPQAGQLYEITLEPFPGSPTGRPTGPILVKGFAKQPVS
jgi:anti-sigma-K factor RskA